MRLDTYESISVVCFYSFSKESLYNCGISSLYSSREWCPSIFAFGVDVYVVIKKQLYQPCVPLFHGV